MNTDSQRQEKIAFIGLGLMGRPMCLNLLGAGYRVWAHNRSAPAREAVASAGATVPGSAAAAADGADIVITMLPDTPDVRGVVLGEGGVLAAMKPGSVLIDMSTISPAATREIAAAAREKGVAMLDAPVSGGDIGAREGTLSIMVGGESETFARCRPVFEVLGRTINHVGPSGAGQSVKLVNQVIGAVTLLAVSEGLLLAAAAGVDMEKCLAAVSGGAAGSWLLSNRGPQMVARDWRPGFTARLQQKDIELALAMARECGAPLPGTRIVQTLYQALLNRDLGSEGNHALVKALEFLSGKKIPANGD